MKKIIILCLFLSWGITSPVFSSNFGKNKVKYQNKNWKSYKSQKFKIIYYIQSSEIIQHAVPIIKNTIYEFQETNIVPYVLSEGVGGFTEYMKGRGSGTL